MNEKTHLLYKADEYKGVLPAKLNNPFRYHPDALCIAAAREVEEFLNRSEAGATAAEGKMFGVLVVKDRPGNLCFLAAFSGLLGQQAEHPYFVPPVFDLTAKDGFFKSGEAEITRINQDIDLRDNAETRSSLVAAAEEAEAKLLEFEKSSAEKLAESKKKRSADRTELQLQLQQTADEEKARTLKEKLGTLDRESMFLKAEHRRQLKRLKTELAGKKEELQYYENETEQLRKTRKEKSSALQDRIFRSFRMIDSQHRVKDILEIFSDAKAGYPPGGTGECAAPKLLQYAFSHDLEPVSMAEFWYGRTNDSEMRVHGNFYPACTGKCGPLLRYMLGPEITETSPLKSKEPEIIYEDDRLLVVDKPEDFLSVPGKSDRPSVCSFIRDRYPDATGSLVTHRLDMDTSGLLIVAKDEETFSGIRKQFEERSIRKVYRAIIDGEVDSEEGVIDLPIAPDYVNRPRQMVDRASGKEAITRYRVVGRHLIGKGERQRTVTEILFFPVTGRTHQLRIHSAHIEGLGFPILGDILYGKAAKRLYLHAETLEFTHPISGKRLVFTKKADFQL